MNLLVSKFRFLEFRLLLSRVAPYNSLPRTVWSEQWTVTFVLGEGYLRIIVAMLKFMLFKIRKQTSFICLY